MIKSMLIFAAIVWCGVLCADTSALAYVDFNSVLVKLALAVIFWCGVLTALEIREQK